MIQVRNSVFETNSSSTHSMVIGPTSDFNEWFLGKLWYNNFWGGTSSEFKDKKLVSKKELIDIYLKSTREELVAFGNELAAQSTDEDFQEKLQERDDFQTSDEWQGDLEIDEESYTTSSGESLTIMCKYGYDC